VAATGLEERRVEVYRWGGSAWASVDSAVNAAAGYVSAQLTELSVWAPMIHRAGPWYAQWWVIALLLAGAASAIVVVKLRR